ncbi:LuxR C-terminal-related transcriptional regulator [Microvirga zambiensis]|uniref:LuxR C-terminal-related transcriptional regulator n=1 Tax=Microvirga zambiensis TaxID=1402137 RepID=UPI00191D74C7|nr:response regulator transcription factor [Microvirga zambiensis]
MSAQTFQLEHDCSSDTASTSGILTPIIPTALIADSLLLRSKLLHILQGTQFALTDAVSAVGPRRFQYFSSVPALVIVEADQNTGRLLEIVKQVRELSPEARIVAVADQFDLRLVRLGNDAGVNGFCLANKAPEVLRKSLELVMLGESVLPCRVLRSIMNWTPEAGHQPVQGDRIDGSKVSEPMARKLSAREIEILDCLMKGEPNKAIARKFGITEATIKVHVKAILRKLGASNRTQAAMWASQHTKQKGGASVNG